MELLRRIFNRQQPPASPDEQDFIDELSAIGNAEAFLSFRPGGRYNDQGRHVRARQIGERLNTVGGKTLMRKVYERVDCPNSRQLTAVWDGIGDWIY